jgi:hypothetical protein
MPHGGYHGTIKIGGNVVQKSDGKGGIKGGIDNRSRLDRNKKPKKKDLDIINEQAKRLKQIKSTPGIDNRSSFLASQTPKAIIADAQQRRIQAANQRNLAERLATGKSVARSEFTGNYGDGFLGLNIGATQTGRPKIREGMTSDQYANYMSGLYDIAPQRMEGLFPFASGKKVRDFSRFMPGLGTLQTIAGSVFGGTKSFIGDKLSGIMNTDVGRDLAAAPSGFLNDLQTMLGMNKSKKEGATTATETKVLDAFQDGSITPGRIEQMAPGVDDVDIFSGKSFDASPGRYSTFYTPGDDKIQQVLMEKGLASLVKKDNIQPKEKPPMPRKLTEYEQEFIDTYGTPMVGALDAPYAADPAEGRMYGLGDRLTRETFRRDSGLPIVSNKTYPMIDPALYESVGYENLFIPEGTIFSPTISNMPALGQEIRTFPGLKDGGSPENYDVLKSINDTMHG